LLVKPDVPVGQLEELELEGVIFDGREVGVEVQGD
jgi:hypothetical protein